MTAQLLISQLEDMGITLYADGEKLKMRGTGTEPTDTQKDALRRFKPEILTILNPPPSLDFSPKSSEEEPSDFWNMKIQASVTNETNEILATVETDRKNFSGATLPSRAEIEAMVADIDDGISSRLDRLRQIRDNHWWEICGCQSFDQFCNKYMKRTGRRIRQLLGAEEAKEALAPEVQRFFRNAPEAQVRAIASVPAEKQQAVVMQALSIASERPDPVGEAAKWRAKDEEGKFVPKVTTADIEAAKVAILEPPPTAPITLFDRDASKPALPSQKPVQSESIPTATEEDYAATEEEARAIVRGEALPTVAPANFQPQDEEEADEPEPAELPEGNGEIRAGHQPYSRHFRVEQGWYNPVIEMLHLNGIDKRFNTAHMSISLAELQRIGVPIDCGEESTDAH